VGKNAYFYVLTPGGKRFMMAGGVWHWWRIVLFVPPQVLQDEKAAPAVMCALRR
jgi:hypothetical protein